MTSRLSVYSSGLNITGILSPVTVFVMMAFSGTCLRPPKPFALGDDAAIDALDDLLGEAFDVDGRRRGDCTSGAPPSSRRCAAQDAFGLRVMQHRRASSKPQVPAGARRVRTGVFTGAAALPNVAFNAPCPRMHVFDEARCETVHGRDRLESRDGRRYRGSRYHRPRSLAATFGAANGRAVRPASSTSASDAE